MTKVDSNTASSHRIKTVIAIALGLAVFFLTEPVEYLIFPNHNLYSESGWKSYSSDRSARISFLLWYGADPNAYVEGGYSSLHTAVHWQSIESTEQLLDAGADVNLPTGTDRGDNLPLDIACTYSEDNFEVIRLVSSRGGKRMRSHPSNWQGKPNPPECFDQLRLRYDQGSENLWGKHD